MRLLTFNLWHGLAPSSPVAFEALEPAGRRALREKLQVEILLKAQADIGFFQEVNPAAVRAPQLAAALSMNSVMQGDLVGLKLFGFGIPFNLNSGLLTLVNAKYPLKKLEGLSLSRPGTHLVQSWASWQLKEERFALFAETELPGWGKVLMINTHLHHGLEATPGFLEELDRVALELEMPASVVSEIKNRMNAGSERRAHELGVLLETLKKYENRYEVVILGGDFNASPASDLGQRLREAGFRDCWLDAHPDDAGLTFDADRNQANHLMQGRFPLTLVVEDLSFSAKTKDALLFLARKQEDRPRRIDYLWLRGGSLKVTGAELIGIPDSEGFAPSDHFGVCADVELG